MYLQHKFYEYIEALVEEDLNKALGYLIDAFSWGPTKQGFNFWEVVEEKKYRISIEELREETIIALKNPVVPIDEVDDLHRLDAIERLENIPNNQEQREQYERLFV